MTLPKITEAETEELLEQHPLDTSHRIYTMPEQVNIDETAQLRQDKAELLAAAQRMVDAYACTGPHCQRCELIAVLAKAGKGA